MTTVSVRFRVRRRTAASWASLNEVLLDAEMGLESDTDRFKFGDGVTAWNSLPYASDGAVSSVNGFTGAVVLTSTNIAEGTNLYYTNTRADARIAAAVGVSVQAASSVLSFLATASAASAAAVRTLLGLGTAATQNTGTSGANVPLMNASNTWSALQIFSSIRISAATPEIALFDNDTAGINALGSFVMRDSTNTARMQIGKPFAGGEVYFDNADDGFRFSKAASGHVFIDTASKRFDFITGYVIRINSQQVIGARGAAVADAVPAVAAPTMAEFNALVTQFNLLLARVRAATGHGLIA